jgi:hypothetical protein
MQNKANFLAVQMNITPGTTRPYENFPLSGQAKNKPNQTQFQTCPHPHNRLSGFLTVHLPALVGK